MEEWKTYKLGEICTKIGSGATPKGGKEAYLGGDTSLIRSQNVLDFSFSWDGLAYINEYQASKLDGVEIERNDVLLNITGDSVARACIVPDDVLPARVNQHVAIIRGNHSIVLNEYILYFLQFKKQNLLSLSQGGATRNALTKGMIENLDILLPELSEQKKIVSILKSLDEKIGCNRRINDNFTLSFLLLTCFVLWLLKLRNDNLQQQIQAFYKTLFVDFEPFKKGEFEESELGIIPKGWNVGKLGELIDIKYGKDHKKLLNGSFPVYGSGGLMRYAEKALYKGESVLIPRKGTLNNVMYVNEAFWTVDTMFYSVPKVNNIMSFVYIYLKNKDLSSFNAGSAVPSMTTEILNNMKVIVPTDGILEEFNKKAFVMFSAIKQNQQESHRLSCIRDSLLPKLISGELKINDLTI